MRNDTAAMPAAAAFPAGLGVTSPRLEVLGSCGGLRSGKSVLDRDRERRRPASVLSTLDARMAWGLAYRPLHNLQLVENGNRRIASIAHAAGPCLIAPCAMARGACVRSRGVAHPRTARRSALGRWVYASSFLKSSRLGAHETQ